MAGGGAIILLDTCTLLWLTSEPGALFGRARRLIRRHRVALGDQCVRDRAESISQETRPPHAEFPMVSGSGRQRSRACRRHTAGLSERFAWAGESHAVGGSLPTRSVVGDRSRIGPVNDHWPEQKWSMDKKINHPLSIDSVSRIKKLQSFIASLDRDGSGPGSSSDSWV
jgi:hypothetical protein